MFTSFETALPTKLIDTNGELITEFSSDEKREIISLKDLPQHMLDALLTREDRVFYSHKGFSYKALTRAIVGKLTRKSLGGGSTLTQQKSTHLCVLFLYQWLDHFFVIPSRSRSASIDGSPPRKAR